MGITMTIILRKIMIKLQTIAQIDKIIMRKKLVILATVIIKMKKRMMKLVTTIYIISLERKLHRYYHHQYGTHQWMNYHIAIFGGIIHTPSDRIISTMMKF